MDRRTLLLSMFGLVAGAGAAVAAPTSRGGETIFDELAALDRDGDLAAEEAQEAQGRRRAPYRGRRVAYGHRYRPHRAVVRYRAPVRQRRSHYWGHRRVCRFVRNRYGNLVRRCWWVR